MSDHDIFLFHRKFTFICVKDLILCKIPCLIHVYSFDLAIHGVHRSNV